MMTRPSHHAGALIFALLSFGGIAHGEGTAAPAGAKGEKNEPAAASAEVLPIPLEPGADYLCQAEVFYVWTPTPPPEVAGTPASAQLGSEPDGAAEEERREFSGVVGETGLVQEEVKNRVTSRIPRAQLEAVAKCKIEHEDRTACVTSKIRRGFDSYNRLDYTARRAMLEAMNRDCSTNLGTCGASEVSEVSCTINRSPDAPPPTKAEPAAAKPEAGKDPKKK